MTSTINFWAILVASVVAFGIGALWYSPILFGKEWMNLAKISDRDVDEGEGRGMWKLYIAQLVITIVLFAVLGFFVSATASRTAGDGAFLGFIAWLGFSLTAAVGDMLWMKKPMKLLLISEICTLVTWIVGGAIIGAWR